MKARTIVEEVLAKELFDKEEIRRVFKDKKEVGLVEYSKNCVQLVIDNQTERKVTSNAANKLARFFYENFVPMYLRVNNEGWL